MRSTRRGPRLTAIGALGVGVSTVVLLAPGATAAVGGRLPSAGSTTSPGTTPAPLPTPGAAAFDASGSVSVFPSPGTPDVSPATGITFRGPGAAALGALAVTGSESGVHPGHVQPDADGNGAT